MNPIAQTQQMPVEPARSKRSDSRSESAPEAVDQIEGAFQLLLGGLRPETMLRREVMDAVASHESLTQATEAMRRIETSRSEGRQSARQHPAETKGPDGALADRLQQGQSHSDGSGLQRRASAGSERSADADHRVLRSASQESPTNPPQGTAPRQTNAAQPGAARAGGEQGPGASASGEAVPMQLAVQGGQARAPQPALASLLAAGQARVSGTAAGMGGGVAPGQGSSNTVQNGLSSLVGGRIGDRPPPRAPVAANPRPDPGADAALRAQLARGLGMALRNGEGTATLRLDPHHLGSLRVEVTVRNSFVQAIFSPTTKEAQRLLEADRGALESALLARGLRVDRVEIRPSPEASSQPFESGGSDSAQDEQGGSWEADSRRSPEDRQTSAGGAKRSDPGTEALGHTGSRAEPIDTPTLRAESGGVHHLIDTVA